VCDKIGLFHSPVFSVLEQAEQHLPVPFVLYRCAPCFVSVPFDWFRKKKQVGTVPLCTCFLLEQKKKQARNSQSRLLAL